MHRKISRVSRVYGFSSSDTRSIFFHPHNSNESKSIKVTGHRCFHPSSMMMTQSSNSTSKYEESLKSATKKIDNLLFDYNLLPMKTTVQMNRMYCTLQKKEVTPFLKDNSMFCPSTQNRYDNVFQLSQKSYSTSHEQSLKEKTQTILDLFTKPNQTSGSPKKITKISLNTFHDIMNDWSKISSSNNQHKKSIDDNNEGGIYAAQQSERLLKILQNNYDKNLEQSSFPSNQSNKNIWKLTPNAVSYNMVCHAYATSGGGTKAAIQAQSILENMIKRCEDYLLSNSKGEGIDQHRYPPPPEPTTITFNTVINAWAKSGDNDAGMKAEEIFKMMEKWSYDCKERRIVLSSSTDGNDGTEHYKGCSPNARSLSGVIDAHANSSTMHETTATTDRVMAIIELIVGKNRELIEKSLKKQTTAESEDKIKRPENEVIVPNVIVFNSVIHAIAKHAKDKNDAEKAETVLRWMEELSNDEEFMKYCQENQSEDDQEDNIGHVKPNTRSFTLVMEAWANVVDNEGDFAARRAEAVLDKMETLYKNGEDVKPNVVSYTTCMSSWAKCIRNEETVNGDNGATAAKVEEILMKLLEMYTASNDLDFRPNTTTFNTCISAYARHRDPIRAEYILDKMEASDYDFVSADTTSYNTLINAYSKSEERNSGQKAMSLLKRMEKNGIDPDSITYNTIIDTFSRVAKRDRDAGDKANNLLQKMIDLGQDKDSRINPSTISFTSTLNCYAKNPDPLSVEKAMKILNQIIGLFEAGNQKLKPDVYLFSTFLNICANSNGNTTQKRQALKYAIQAFEQLKGSPEFGLPNQYIYGSLIKACSKLSQNADERGRLLENIFVQAQKDGQVSSAVLNQFVRGAPFQIKRKLLRNYRKVDRGTQNETYVLPPEWYENVRRKDRP